SLIAAILSADPPPISSAQILAPPILDHVVRKCLAKNPEDRWQNARDIAGQLQWILDQRSPSGASTVERSNVSVRHRTLPWILLALCLAIISTLIGERFLHQTKIPPLIQLSLLPPEDSVDVMYLAVSPNGKYVALMNTTADEQTALWLRSLDSQTLRKLSGTE